MNCLMGAFGCRKPSVPVISIANTVFTNSEITAKKAAEEKAAKKAAEEEAAKKAAEEEAAADAATA